MMVGMKPINPSQNRKLIPKSIGKGSRRIPISKSKGKKK